MKKIIYVILLILCSCSQIMIEEVSETSEEIIIEEPFILNISTGEKYKISY